MALTSRQRLLRLFNGQDLDRVPIWLLAPYHRLVYYADLYNIEAYRPVTQAREKLGPETVLIGNVQYDDLERQNPGVIDTMVRDVMEEGRRSGRFILSPSSGPYDPNPSPTLIRNYLSFVQAGIRYGKLD